MTWPIPKLAVRETPLPPRFFIWFSLLLCFILLTVAYLYFFKPLNAQDNPSKLLYFFLNPVIAFLLLLGIRFLYHDIKSFHVGFHNQAISKRTLEWKAWARREINLLQSKRLTALGESDTALLKSDSPPINRGQKLSLTAYDECPVWERKPKIIEEWLASLLTDEYVILHQKQLAVYIVDPNNTKIETPNTESAIKTQIEIDAQPVETQSAGITHTNEFSELIQTTLQQDAQFNITLREISPNNLTKLLNHLIDSEDPQISLLFFIDETTEKSEEFTWWLIGSLNKSDENLSTTQIQLLRPLETNINNLEMALSQLIEQQLSAEKFKKLWITGEIREADMTLLQSVCQKLTLGFMPTSINNSENLYGNSSSVRIATTISLLSECLIEPALLLDVQEEQFTFITLMPINKLAEQKDGMK